MKKLYKLHLHYPILSQDRLYIGSIVDIVDTSKNIVSNTITVVDITEESGSFNIHIENNDLTRGTFTNSVIRVNMDSASPEYIIIN